MWILPSRGRPKNLIRFFEHWHLTKADTPGVVVLDRDDPELDGYREVTIPSAWSLIVIEPIGLGATFNYVFDNWPNNPWYGMLADDVIPRTKGWDRILVNAAGNDGVSYADDGINGERQVTHCVLGGDLVRSLGWICLPGLKRIYIDNVITEIGQDRRVLHYCGHVSLEHMHFSNNKSPMDHTYEKPDAASDRDIYEKWQKKRLDRIAKTSDCVELGTC